MAALEVSSLNPLPGPPTWDVLVLLESGETRTNELIKALGKEHFRYAYLRRPGDYDLGVLIILRKGSGASISEPNVSLSSEYGSPMGNFAYLTLQLIVGSRRLWVGGVHLKSGDRDEDRAYRNEQVNWIQQETFPFL